MQHTCCIVDPNRSTFNHTLCSSNRDHTFQRGKTPGRSRIVSRCKRIKPGPEIMKTISCSTQLSMKFWMLTSITRSANSAFKAKISHKCYFSCSRMLKCQHRNWRKMWVDYLGGPKGMLVPLSNYWGGPAPLPPAPRPSSYAYDNLKG